jgi:hypothetical protein
MISSQSVRWCEPAPGFRYHPPSFFTSGVRTINFADPADKARPDRMVALVMQMLELNKRLQDAKLEHEKTLLSRQVEATDAAIDALVYELYGLTEEEIGIVEGK